MMKPDYKCFYLLLKHKVLKKKIPKAHEKASWSGVEACLGLGGLDPAWV